VSLSVADFDFVRALVRDASAIQIEPGKEYLVESRLLPLARATGQGSVPELVHELRRNPAGPLREQVVEAMTTNETSFFRDTHPFRALATAVLPELMKARRAERAITIWSAACSSGQEAYSIAMVLADTLAADPGWRTRIVATDLSQEMLVRTRRGRYTQLEVNRGLPAPQLVKHFRRAGTEWEAAPGLRAMVETRVLNLAAPWPPLPPMDVVFLRNVLIYFDIETKRRILARVRDVLRPDGWLFLGGAETTLNLDDAFERVQIERAMAYRLRGKALT
jgi:chemotaxis protein methyltransferase CheR